VALASTREYTARVPTETAIILADAHLGRAPAETADHLHRFLATVPGRASHLVINGDLFDFWFEYRTVIPRRAFPTLHAIAGVCAAGVEVIVTGGNHDRWGGAFWREQLGASFHPAGVTLRIAGRRIHVTHGDGMVERRLSGRIMHAVTRFRPTAAVFRWLHPDVGMPLVGALSGVLGDRTRTEAEIARAAADQAQFARAYLAQHPDVEGLVLAHTHRAALERVGPQWYLNPGAWFDGGAYAVVSAEGPALHRFA